MGFRTWLMVVLIVLIAAPALLLAFVNTPPGRQLFASLAEKRLERDVQFDGYIYPLLLSWLPGLHVSGLSVANMEHGRSDHMANIGVMEVTFRPKALLKGNLRIRHLSLIDSDIHLERNAEKQANWQFSSDPSDDTSFPSLGHLYLENSTLTYLDVPRKTDLTLKANTEEDHFAVMGKGRHLGQAFALEGDVSARCMAHRGKSCPVQFTLSVGQTALRADGTFSGLAPIGRADFMLDIKGADMAELFPLFGIALPMTPPYHLKGKLVYENERWHFINFAGTTGESDLLGDILWDTSEERPVLSGKLTSDKLRFVDLGPLIGLAPEQRVSPEQKELAAQQEASPYLVPNVPLDISRVSAMDADIEFTGRQVISPTLPLDDFYMKLTLDDRLMKLTPVRFGTAKGDISANMVIDARKLPVQNRAEITFSKLTLSGLLSNMRDKVAGVEIEEPEGEIGGRMTVVGPGKSLHEMLANASGEAGLGMQEGRISNLLVKLLSLDIARSLGFLLTGDRPLAIRCIIASFDIDKGLMRTKRFVIDTADTNIQIGGTVDLENEQLSLRVLPAPKEPTLLSLRSPIDIQGTLKHPDLSIEKGPLAARGAIATGLAALAPAAAIAAFIEGGLGKDSDCVALFKEMNAKTGEIER